jgi:hypothetical protein
MKHIVDVLLSHYGVDNKDGTGLSWIENRSIVMKKSREPAIKFILNNHYHPVTKSLIAHVRAATTGGVTDNNAHPFISEDSKLSLVHNGMLNCYEKAKKELKNKQHVFKTPVDSELLLHAYEQYKNKFIEKLAEQEVSGWANVLLQKTDGTILAYSDGSIWYKITEDGIIVLQTQLLDGMKHLPSGHLLTIKNGEILKDEDIGALKSPAVAGTYAVYYNHEALSAEQYDSTLPQQTIDDTVGNRSGECEKMEWQFMELFGLEFSDVIIEEHGRIFHVALKGLDSFLAQTIIENFPACEVEEKVDQMMNIDFEMKKKKLRRRLKVLMTERILLENPSTETLKSSGELSDI